LITHAPAGETKGKKLAGEKIFPRKPKNSINKHSHYAEKTQGKITRALKLGVYVIWNQEGGRDGPGNRELLSQVQGKTRSRQEGGTLMDEIRLKEFSWRKKRLLRDRRNRIGPRDYAESWEPTLLSGGSQEKQNMQKKQREKADWRMRDDCT